jgi:alanyl-tRNA synthetase
MQQFKRFYLFPNEAPETRITTCQRCVRTGDIDEVGDQTHLTFFEMLGNFTFGYPQTEGSYFKEQAIAWAWEFLTEELGIDKSRIYATYFRGENGVLADIESFEILKKIEGLTDIREQGFEDNFWSLGTEGSPGGPTVEFYVDDVEVWNIVFNELVLENGVYTSAGLKGIDTGMGLDRMAAMLQGKSDVYQLESFAPIIQKIEELSGLNYGEGPDSQFEECWVDVRRAFRIIIDHLKASAYIASEKLEPSNTNQGYILRRLIRRAVRYGWTIKINSLSSIVREIIDIEQLENGERILNVITSEEEKFKKTIEEGLKKSESVIASKTPLNEDVYSQIMQAEDKGEQLARVYSGETPEGLFGATSDEIKNAYIGGKEAFNLFQTYGFPIEMIIEMAQEKKLFVDIRGFRAELESHQEKSRTASAGMFKGGLADNKIETTRLHTAAHLLLAALRHELGDEIEQKGSNITEERLRFDFNYPEKLSDEQKQKIEDLVNLKIEEALPVTMQELSIEDAKNSGATGSFHDKYGDKVKIFTIGSMEEPFSREICGGPHVENTSELGRFKIAKEESSSSGIRRIKAVLE